MIKDRQTNFLSSKGYGNIGLNIEVQVASKQTPNILLATELNRAKQRYSISLYTTSQISPWLVPWIEPSCRNTISVYYVDN